MWQPSIAPTTPGKPHFPLNLDAMYGISLSIGNFMKRDWNVKKSLVHEKDQLLGFFIKSNFDQKGVVSVYSTINVDFL